MNTDWKSTPWVPIPPDPTSEQYGRLIDLAMGVDVARSGSDRTVVRVCGSERQSGFLTPQEGIDFFNEDTPPPIWIRGSNALAICLIEDESGFVGRWDNGVEVWKRPDGSAVFVRRGRRRF